MDTESSLEIITFFFWQPAISLLDQRILKVAKDAMQVILCPQLRTCGYGSKCQMGKLTTVEFCMPRRGITSCISIMAEWFMQQLIALGKH
jgi:hypothetical protein